MIKQYLLNMLMKFIPSAYDPVPSGVSGDKFDAMGDAIEQYHVGVDLAGDTSPRLFEDGDDAMEKGITLGIDQYIKLFFLI